MDHIIIYMRHTDSATMPVLCFKLKMPLSSAVESDMTMLVQA